MPEDNNGPFISRFVADIKRVFVPMLAVPPGLKLPVNLTIAGCFSSACVISVVVGLTWDAQRVLYPWVGIGVITGYLAVRAGLRALRAYCGDCTGECNAAGSDGIPDLQCQRLFLRYQIGVGFALLLLGVVSVFVFAGLMHRVLLDTPIQIGSAQLTEDQKASLASTCSLRIILSLNMAVLGALFFIANSLRKLRICHRRFDSMVFWGGLWYRIGEAVLFTLVFSLVIHWQNPDPTKAAAAYDLWLPLLALMLGMFIKTAERIVFGLAERIFAAAAAMIPVQPEMIEPPGSRHNATPGADGVFGRGNGSNVSMHEGNA